MQPRGHEAIQLALGMQLKNKIGYPHITETIAFYLV